MQIWCYDTDITAFHGAKSHFQRQRFLLVMRTLRLVRMRAQIYTCLHMCMKIAERHRFLLRSRINGSTNLIFNTPVYVHVATQLDLLVLQQVILVPDTEGTSQFKKSSAPLYTKFYFFNVTNQDDVVNKGAHPIVSQCGPYTYRYM